MLMHNLSLTRFEPEHKPEYHSQKTAYADFLACTLANNAQV